MITLFFLEIISVLNMIDLPIELRFEEVKNNYLFVMILCILLPLTIFIVLFLALTPILRISDNFIILLQKLCFYRGGTISKGGKQKTNIVKLYSFYSVSILY